MYVSTRGGSGNGPAAVPLQEEVPLLGPPHSLHQAFLKTDSKQRPYPPTAELSRDGERQRRRQRRGQRAAASGEAGQAVADLGEPSQTEKLQPSHAEPALTRSAAKRALPSSPPTGPSPSPSTGPGPSPGPSKGRGHADAAMAGLPVTAKSQRQNEAQDVQRDH
jgi:hypothetical protein